jgi:UDP-N-acetylglucosamine 4,6-dehydratase (inverting)
MGNTFDGKVILLTGGTGSFGKKFTEIVLKEHRVKALRIFSRDELKQLEMNRQFTDGRLRFLLGDVRDKERLSRAMNGVDMVVHAAAMKQVPASEYNPLEAVKTNILGGANVIDAAIDNQVKKVMYICTDKAVHPINLYGATKLVSEKLFVQANAYATRRAQFSCVRYGNVVGSRGSVIPLFLKQRTNGTVTITDAAMTRFWITLDQGVRFVLSSMERMAGGEIFIPKIPSMRLTDVVKAIAPEAKLDIIGIRPGEKLHEQLITREDAPRTRDFDTFYVITPEHNFWEPGHDQEGRKVAADFQYSSETNTHWMTSQDLMRCLADIQVEN